MVTKKYTIGETTYIEYENGHRVIAVDYFGNSGDAKPTDCVHNGECFLEADTGNVFVFNEEAKTWHKAGA